MRTFLAKISERSGHEWSTLEVTLVEEEGIDPYLELQGPFHQEPIRLAPLDLAHELAQGGILRVRTAPGTMGSPRGVVFGVASTAEDLKRLRRALATRAGAIVRVEPQRALRPSPLSR